jgi:hypothetical protein
MEKDTWNKTLLHTIQYRFEDGIIELVMGMMFLLVVIYFYLMATMDNSQLAEVLPASIGMLLICGGI